MKKIFGLLSVIVVIAITGSMALMPARVYSDNSQEQTGSALPDSISKIVQRSCMDCHANDGNSMAKSRINFSKWETYKP